jgi:ribosomal protein L11 methyltransferase
MKYYEVKFRIVPMNDDARDVLAAMAGDAGFETFEEAEEGLTGYVQQELFDEATLKDAIADFPFEGITIGYDICEAEDKDWNEQWEQEGFEPIEVRCMTDNVTCSDEQLLVIHDGRHLPSDIDHQPSAIMIEIDAHLAFGTGTHETTRMICATLLGTPLKGKRVLDCGCGTGILGICALKLGAAQCTAYDIDEWSVDNTRHNSIINQVDSLLTVMHGDASLLDSQQVSFDLVMANINRNILLQDMSRFVSVMAPGSTLLLSGFYEEDCEMLTHAAQACGLTLKGKKQDDAWAMLIFTRP